MKPIVLTLSLLVFGLYSLAQVSYDDNKVGVQKNSFYAELLGNGIFYSINYDRLFSLNQKTNLSGRVGFTIAPGPVLVMAGGNFELNLLLGRGKHHFEIGSGFSYLSNTTVLRDQNGNVFAKASSSFVSGRLGYRYQKPEGGFMLRIGFTPMFELNGASTIQVADLFLPYGGISLGYTLK